MTSEAVTLRVENGSINGSKPFVPDAGAADLFLIAFRTDTGLALAAVEKDASGISIRLEAVMVETKRIGTVSFNDVDVRDSRLCRNCQAGHTECTPRGVSDHQTTWETASPDHCPPDGETTTASHPHA